MHFSRRLAALALGSALGCVSFTQTLRVLPSLSDPVAQRDSAAEFRQIRVENGAHQGSVWDLTFSPDGRHLYSAGDDKVIRVWDRSGGLTQVLRLPIGPAGEGAVRALDVSPEERWIAVGGCQGCTGFWTAEDSHLLYLLDAASGRISGVGQGHRWTILSVAFSPDGRLLASASVDGMLRLWSVDSDGRISQHSELQGHAAPVVDVAWFPDGRHLVSAGLDGMLILWATHPAGGWYPERVLRGHVGASKVDVTPDGNRIVSGGRDGTLRVWSVEGGEPEIALQLDGVQILDVAVSPDGSQVVYGSGGVARSGVGILSLVSDTPARFTSARGGVLAVAWSPAGDEIASGEGHRGSISLRGASDLDVIRHRLESGGQAVFRVGVLQNGFAWSHQRENPGFDRMLDTTSLTLSPDVPADVRIAASFDPRIQKVSLNSDGDGFVAISGSVSYRGRVTSHYLNFATYFGGDLLALASDGGLHLFDFRENSRMDCSGHESSVNGVAAMANGEIAVTGSSDQTLRFWDTTSCRELLAFHETADGRWAAWTPEGYFTASPGGETLLGVHQNRGAREAPSFDPIPEAQRRDGLIASTLSRGSAPETQAASDAR